MTRPIPLSEDQKEGLRRLEPALQRAAQIGDYDRAKRLTAKIQQLLRPTGHETRLMTAKNWYFEAALNTDRIAEAKRGFIGVRKKTSNRTRVYLEATALLAICHIREANLVEAEPLMAEVFARDKCIRSDRTRKIFRKRIVERFDEEGVLSALQGKGHDLLDSAEIDAGAIELVRTRTEDEIYSGVADSLPPSVIQYLQKVDQLARNLLPPAETKFLPPPPDHKEKRRIGKTVVGSVRRVIWRSLCDPESDVNRLWNKGLVNTVLNDKLIATSIAAAMSGMNLGYKMIAVSTTALAIKLGVEVFCDRFMPEGIMQARVDR